MNKNKVNHKSNITGKKSVLLTASIIVQLIALIVRIPLTRIIGDEGNGIYAAVFELYSIALLLTVGCMPEAIAGTIALRTARGQYKNAYRVFKIAFLWNFIAGLIVCLLLVLGADYFANTMMLIPMSAIPLRMLGPVAILMGMVVTLQGYFQGMGTIMPTSVSQIVEQVIGAVSSIIASLLLCNYGIKVAHLLHNNSFAASYAVMGISVGTIIGVLVSFFFLLFVFGMYRQQRKKQIDKDMAKGKESTKTIIYSLLYALIPIILITGIYPISNLLDQLIYNRIMTDSGQAAKQVVNFGIYAGKYKVLIWIPITVASMIWSPLIPALNAAYERVDIRVIRNKVLTVFRLTMVIILPFSIGLILMARPVLNTFYAGEITLACQMLQEGSVAMTLIAYASVGNAVLLGMNKHKTVTIHNVVSLVLHIITLIIMLKYMGLGIHAIVYANMMMAAMTSVLNHIALKKYMKYKIEWIRTFLIPFVGSVIMGLIASFIYKIFEKAIGNDASVILAFIFSLILYYILIVMFRSVNEKDLLGMPFGKTIIKILKLAHVI